MSSMYIDGDIFVTEDGVLERFTSGKSDGWEVGDPADQLLRPTASADLVAGAGDRRQGSIYAFDRGNARILAFEKESGQYVAQYRLADGAVDWEELLGMYVVPGIEELPDTLVWLSQDAVHQVTLVAVPDDGSAPEPTASGGPTSSDDAAPGSSVDVLPAP